ncbi:SigE family RNA polymerase sigma factor [Nocardioides sp. HDW12B]|uniref:SigE family RNA polymerase sigma factor n=1 Tax=Nocardioides sp. HDW12B TaxID=2714939 RepID=UPI001F0F5807|nr:SigE family RNA polymerase sigma factor [Nocardioides sp. HDW12B]
MAARTRLLPRDGSAAVSDLFMAHHRRLVGLAALLVDDRQVAEDVVQDAFAALHRRWQSLRDPNAAVAYLNRAVVNGSRDTLRRRRRADRATLRLVPRSEELPSAEHGVVTHQDADRMWATVTALPVRQRQVLVLRYYLDQSESEIAETLGVSRGSVKQHASRGLAALAHQWEEPS